MTTTWSSFFFIRRFGKSPDTPKVPSLRDQSIAASSKPSLPTRPQIFFGRDDELKTIIELIFSSTSAARIAILGPGGVGKTVLARAVLTHEKVAYRFRDSRYLVPCESLTSRDALLVALANSLSLLKPGRTTFDSYSEALEPRVLSSLASEECILCLDTFESPWDQPGPVKRAVETLLARITTLTSVTVLITLRGAERPRETAWTPPMLRPLNNFSRDAAKSAWESLTGTCDEWAERLIDAVDSLPLAVTLLCGLAEVSTAETLWERWQKENITLLEKEKGDKLASLEFSISLSLKSSRMAADDSSKRLLGILSLFPEGIPEFPPPEFRRLFPDIPDMSRSLDVLLKCSLAACTAEKRVRVNPLVRLYCERHGLASPEDARTLRGYHITSEITSSHASLLPAPHSTAVQARRHPLGVGELPVRDASARATQPITPSPTTLPERGELVGDASIAPASTWWNRLKHKRKKPIEQTQGYFHIRSRVTEAIGGALGTAACIGHEALFLGVDFLRFVPVPALDLAGRLLLKIWDAIDMVETNRLASLRLIKRCADILISIRGEIAKAGDNVAEELWAPITKLEETFGEIRNLLNELGERPFLKRYLKRNGILSSISECNSSLSDALGMFGISIQIRILKLHLANEPRQGKEARVTPDIPPTALQPSTSDPENVRKELHDLCATENAHDRALDAADLRELMSTALAEKDDVAMINVLQIVQSEIPEAIKTLERARKRVVEHGQLDTEESTVVPPSPQQEAGKDNGPSVEPLSSGVSQRSADALDREFIETGIKALRRLSKDVDLDLPRWAITRYEIDLGLQVGVGCFSRVHRGTWCKQTVAVKVLSEATPRKMFLREVELWKSLYHPNVLELFGASSTSGEPPWFLVSKYCPRGSLAKYLTGLSKADAERVDTLKMIHEISEGMAYLHKRDVLHGDLKAANILVDNDTRCVISDFGQSEIKSEVYRLSRILQPRGTLRWQAPELMRGPVPLTPKMDVYAFAICCEEILTKGEVPWVTVDDEAVRSAVLNGNLKPSFPPSNLINGQLMNLIHESCDHMVSYRPSFEQIAHQAKKQREERSAQNNNSQMFDTPMPVPLVTGWDAQNPHLPHHSPFPIRLEERERSLISRIQSLPGFEDSLKPPPKAATSAEPLSFLMDHLPSSPTPEHETFDDIIKQVERFRILVIGRSGVGKSSLMNCAFGNVNARVEVQNTRGADIEQEFVSPENHDFVLHDSKGFEPGDLENFETVRKFVEERSLKQLLKERIHGIWLCTETPTAGGRVFETGDEKLLEFAYKFEVPLVLVFTQYDRLVRTKEFELLEGNPDLDPASRRLRSVKEAQESFKGILRSLKVTMDILGIPMPTYVPVSVRRGYEKDVSSLVRITTDAAQERVNGDAWVLWSMAQRANLPVQIKACITEGIGCIQVSGFARWKNAVLDYIPVFTGSSPESGQLSLRNCLEKVHKKIVTCWNVKGEVLDSPEFQQLMLCLVQDIHHKVKSVFVQRLSTSIQEDVPSVKRLLIAYIVDLINVLRDFFTIALRHELVHTTARMKLLEAFESYARSSSRQRIYDIICSKTWDERVLTADGIGREVRELLSEYL